MGINLLPIKYQSRSDLQKLMRFIKDASIISVASFLLFGFAIGAYMLVISLQAKRSETRQDQLKSTMKQIEESEFKFFTARDRLKKVQNVLGGVEESSRDVSEIETLNSVVPSGASIVSTKLDDKGVFEVSFSLNSSIDLGGLIAKLSSSENYKTVRLKDFTYSPSAGYLVNLEISLI